MNIRTVDNPSKMAYTDEEIAYCIKYYRYLDEWFSEHSYPDEYKLVVSDIIQNRQRFERYEAGRKRDRYNDFYKI